MNYPRAAFLPDTFHEVNGVARTSRQFEAFARRRQIPFLSIHCGRTRETTQDGNVRVVQLTRGPVCIGLDANLDYDPFLFRQAEFVLKELQAFGAELIHITGPGDLGALGCYAARRLNLPLVISWHTSLHEYAGRRLERALGFAGPRLSGKAGSKVEKLALQILAWYYRKADVVLAPNEELIELMHQFTRKPVLLMQRGVDTNLFSPAHRNRVTETFRIGYVGRLTAEKGVRFLAEMANTLVTLGREHFEIMVVGEGREQAWLRKNTPHAIFAGVLEGERLSEAYANMDLFVFPSTTDTFGNVVLEALASGVPAVVTNSGGPKFLVKSGETGHVAASGWDFISFVNQLMTDPERQRRMSKAARHYACLQSWDSVFEQVFQAYEHCRPSTGTWLHAADIGNTRIPESRRTANSASFPL
ncbi:MAG: glycosyltransferase [Acidobacteriaceae bacterium]|nr:glycosyltransferase [Acidobacteriaceae bacterium]